MFCTLSRSHSSIYIMNNLMSAYCIINWAICMADGTLAQCIADGLDAHQFANCKCMDIGVGRST